MTLFYILSGKNGITSFTYKELELLEKNGVKFKLLFTKYNQINNIPKDSWEFMVVDKKTFLLKSIFNLIHILFTPLFFESIKNKEFRYYLLAQYCKKRLAASVPEHIHVQMGDHKLILGYYLKKILKTPKLSATLHAHELYSEFRYAEIIRFKFLLNSCDKVFTISDYNKQILLNELDVKPGKIEKMYLYPSFQKEGIKEKKKILMTGNWEYKKGYVDVIEALTQINRDDYIVLIAGRAVNPEVDLDLPRIISDKGLDQKVKLLGHLNKILLEFMYTYCDVFLLPSKTEYYPDGNPKEREGIPVALMEAISFNLPIISTRHAGIPELVVNYLVEEGNIQEIKEAIEKCLNNIEMARLDTEENAKILNSSFTFNNIMPMVNFFNT